MDAVKKHQHFLNKDCDDWVLMRADFSNCLIEDIELKKLDMMQVNFAGATLKGCKFKDVDLTSSNFESAIIEGVLMDNVCMNMTNFRDARITICIIYGMQDERSCVKKCSFKLCKFY